MQPGSRRDILRHAGLCEPPCPARGSEAEEGRRVAPALGHEMACVAESGGPAAQPAEVRIGTERPCRLDDLAEMIGEIQVLDLAFAQPVVESPVPARFLRQVLREVGRDPLHVSWSERIDPHLFPEVVVPLVAGKAVTRPAVTTVPGRSRVAEAVRKVVHRPEARSGQGEEHRRMGRHRLRHALTPFDAGTHELAGVSAVGVRARRTTRLSPRLAGDQQHPVRFTFGEGVRSARLEPDRSGTTACSLHASCDGDEIGTAALLGAGLELVEAEFGRHGASMSVQP